ncbi:hypothetical protein AVEN_28529-1 [Araneus ventricosus]|uniref:Uncharacterized protein n=1 Tax=Araneus ventricosus TaxID=182803 RepID=A0A4Y2SA33_ARAVE|nr:hypothetical protein AVEN_28529-1 [Araneus ventricosus]
MAFLQPTSTCFKPTIHGQSIPRKKMGCKQSQHLSHFQHSHLIWSLTGESECHRENPSPAGRSDSSKWDSSRLYGFRFCKNLAPSSNVVFHFMAQHLKWIE